MKEIRPKNSCVSANPTDPDCFVPTMQCFAILKENKKMFIPTDPWNFQVNGHIT